MDEHFITPETMLRPGQGDEFFRKQLASMVHLVPFSNCESEDALMSNLSAQDEQNSWNTGPSSTSQSAVDSDPLLHPEDGGVAGLRAAAGAQVSGGGRRLRPQRSNPDATPAKRVRQDTNSGVSASPLQSSQPLRPKVERTRRSRVEASPGASKLKKSDAVPLTVENILGGRVSHPKVQLGWRRSEKPKSHKCDMHNEAKELQQLSAAVSLLPDDLANQADDEVIENARVVEIVLERNAWPWFAWRSLLQRRAQRALASQDWASFLDTIWAWSRQSDATPVTAPLDIMQARFVDVIAVMTASGDNTFIHAPEDRAGIVRDWLVKDALADLMAKNEKGVEGILELHRLVQDKPSPFEDAAPQAFSLYKEAVGAVAGLAGLVQEDPVGMEQFEALRALTAQDEQTQSA